MAEILYMIALYICQPYVQFKMGNKVFYVQALNFIYGTIKAVLLFYKNMSKDLVEQGFTINHYDICVSNKYSTGIR